PALAQGSLLDCETICALTTPSPVSCCQTKWKVSVVPQMSLPPAVIVQVPLLSNCPPKGMGLPISAQFQFKGQVLSVTVLNTTVLSFVVLCEVAAMPASSVPVRFGSVTLDPGTNVQVMPSLEV